MRSGALSQPVVATLAAALVIAPAWGQPADWQAGIARITTRKDLERAPGTAFVVEVRNGNAYLVTSAHVVEGDPAPQVEFVAEPEKIFPASVRGIEPEERGLALLVVSNAPGGVHPIPESPQPTALGANVAIAGFPAALNRFSVVDTTVASTGGRDLFLSRETDEGFSGGPVLVSGSVVGIVYGREGGFGKALGASSVKPFIEGNSLSWGAMAGVPNQQSGGIQLAGAAGAPNRPSGTAPVARFGRGSAALDRAEPTAHQRTGCLDAAGPKPREPQRRADVCVDTVGKVHHGLLAGRQ